MISVGQTFGRARQRPSADWPLSSYHTRRAVLATCRRDTSPRQVASCDMYVFNAICRSDLSHEFKSVWIHAARRQNVAHTYRPLVWHALATCRCDTVYRGHSLRPHSLGERIGDKSPRVTGPLHTGQKAHVNIWDKTDICAVLLSNETSHCFISASSWKRGCDSKNYGNVNRFFQRDAAPKAIEFQRN